MKHTFKRRADGIHVTTLPNGQELICDTREWRKRVLVPQQDGTFAEEKSDPIWVLPDEFEAELDFAEDSPAQKEPTDDTE